MGCSAHPSRSRAGLQAQLLEAIAPEGTSEHRGDTRALGRAPQALGLCTGLRCSCRGTNSHLLHSCHRANLPDKLLLASKIQAGKLLFPPYNQPEPILHPHVTLPSHPTPPQLGTGAVRVHFSTAALGPCGTWGHGDTARRDGAGELSRALAAAARGAARGHGEGPAAWPESSQAPSTGSGNSVPDWSPATSGVTICQGTSTGDGQHWGSP